MERKVKCPLCGDGTPLAYRETARRQGVFVGCKGRGCKKAFEIKLGDTTK